MALALQIEDYLPRLTEEDHLFPPPGSMVAEPLAIPYGEVSAAAAERLAQDRAIDRFGRKVDLIQSGCARLLGDAEKEIGRGEVVDLDGLISQLEEMEEQYRMVLLPDLALAERERRSSRGAAARSWDRALELLRGALEAPRDCRWQLMALRAEREDEGDAPAFDDPEALARYLASV